MPVLRNTKLLISQYFGQRPELGGFFGCQIRPNIILSRLNKIRINSGTIGRYYGGNLMVEFYRFTLSLDSVVAARTTNSNRAKG